MDRGLLLIFRKLDAPGTVTLTQKVGEKNSARMELSIAEQYKMVEELSDNLERWEAMQKADLETKQLQG